MRRIVKENFIDKIAKQDTIGLIFKKVMDKHRKLSKTDQENLVEQIGITGDRLLCEKLFNHNFKYVLSVCKAMNMNVDMVEFGDLLAAGSHGLWTAVVRVKNGFYDSSKGNFLSYATYYIQGYILSEAVHYNRFIRVNSQVYYNSLLLKKKCEKHFGLNGEELSVEDAYDFLLDNKVGPTIAKSILELNNHSFDYGFSKLELPMDPDTLDIPEIDVMDTVAESTDFLTMYSKSDFYQVLQRIQQSDVGVLTERQFDVIVWYYGLQMEKPLTLVEIGEIMNCSREYARQIKNKAIKRLRNHADLFREYLCDTFPEDPSD